MSDYVQYVELSVNWVTAKLKSGSPKKYIWSVSAVPGAICSVLAEYAQLPVTVSVKETVLLHNVDVFI